ncbi:nuclear transport factor 2 family protein [Nocardiopsis aegyptia]|uniref:Ketosteroid isomerase-like protein n=1 Tax=Nocardiopsis aegyptia TaxID=220378 RepID=A0A7Z0JC69_9ACTN|nr:nuclear transport factor 2 family protein [Nocardiopsis aegyptia]NYJ37068.1 ketosteroid isomerase-like protein [Nocardiopsis aegyptia]
MKAEQDMTGDTSTIQEFVEEYFAAAIAHDQERYLALFSDDVIVHDDGRTHHGLAQVRAWHSEAPPVRYDLHEATGDPAAFLAAAEVSGDFPGSPIILRFSFQRNARGKITSLGIEP